MPQWFEVNDLREAFRLPGEMTPFRAKSLEMFTDNALEVVVTRLLTGVTRGELHAGVSERPVSGAKVPGSFNLT